MEYEGDNDNNIEVGVKTLLKHNGDFRNQECLDLMNETDIVVTNPPFSLAREYFACLMESHKSFLIIGDINMITYCELFSYIKDGKIWLGNNSIKEFIQPDGSIKKFGNKLWYTNFDIKKRHKDLLLSKHYNKIEYPYYNNYNAIHVDKVSNIPCDFNGIMGVPITFLNKYNPDQFEIIGMSANADTMDIPVQLGEAFIKEYRRQGGTGHFSANMYGVYYFDNKGKAKVPYGRIFIRKKLNT